MLVAYRVTEWSRSPHRRVQKERKWCLSVKELGAALRLLSQPSVASAASGSSAWWDDKASPHACSSASGESFSKNVISYLYNRKEKNINTFAYAETTSSTVHTWAKMRSLSPTRRLTGNSSPHITSTLLSFWFITLWVERPRPSPKLMQYDGLQDL